MCFSESDFVENIINNIAHCKVVVKKNNVAHIVYSIQSNNCSYTFLIFFFRWQIYISI